jgi:hypothetical protein
MDFNEQDPFLPQFNLNDQSFLLNEVIFKFPSFNTVPGFYNHVLTLDFGDGQVSDPILSGNALPVHTYPVNNTSAPVSYSVVLLYDGVPKNTVVITFNRNYSVGGAGFSLPSTIHHLTSTKLVAPPVPNAFPPGVESDIYNSNTLGAADVYIQFAPSHNGKLLKPLIFVDGIDFDETVYTYNGQTVRHGSTGWDIFQFGNTGSDGNSFDTDESEYRAYPSALSEIGAAPNDYDIVFIDFSRGADWIQKNGELLIELITWVNNEKAKNRLDGLCTVDNAVIGASMGGQVARWALRTMEKRGLDHETHTYVSFDSPQKGANIPLGIQAFALLASVNDPNEADLWKRLNRPAARQMIINHLLEEKEAHQVSIELMSDNPCSQFPPLPLFFYHPEEEYPHTGQIRNNFTNEMASLGYPNLTWNVGISCGANTGEGQGFDDSEAIFKADIPVPSFIFDCGDNQIALDAQIFAANGGISDDKTTFHFCPPPDPAPILPLFNYAPFSCYFSKGQNQPFLRELYHMDSQRYQSSERKHQHPSRISTSKK